MNHNISGNPRKRIFNPNLGDLIKDEPVIEPARVIKTGNLNEVLRLADNGSARIKSQWRSYKPEEGWKLCNLRNLYSLFKNFDRLFNNEHEKPEVEAIKSQIHQLFPFQYHYYAGIDVIYAHMQIPEIPDHPHNYLFNGASISDWIGLRYNIFSDNLSYPIYDGKNHNYASGHDRQLFLVNLLSQNDDNAVHFLKKGFNIDDKHDLYLKLTGSDEPGKLDEWEGGVYLLKSEFTKDYCIDTIEINIKDGLMGSYALEFKDKGDAI